MMAANMSEAPQRITVGDDGWVEGGIAWPIGTKVEYVRAYIADETRNSLNEAIAFLLRLRPSLGDCPSLDYLLERWNETIVKAKRSACDSWDCSLIATAPDTLAELKRIREEALCHIEDFDSTITDAVIAKAEGAK